ncbi:MAG: hypothetical protein Q7T21_01830 [Gallionella sp.]|nr:hypothetical protein [Gallionella sp.]
MDAFHGGEFSISTLALPKATKGGNNFITQVFVAQEGEQYSAKMDE